MDITELNNKLKSFNEDYDDSEEYIYCEDGGSIGIFIELEYEDKIDELFDDFEGNEKDAAKLLNDNNIPFKYMIKMEEESNYTVTSDTITDAQKQINKLFKDEGFKDLNIEYNLFDGIDWGDVDDGMFISFGSVYVDGYIKE